MISPAARALLNRFTPAEVAERLVKQEELSANLEYDNARLEALAGVRARQIIILEQQVGWDERGVTEKAKLEADNAALRRQVEMLEHATLGRFGSRKLIALFVLQEELDDLLPELGLCSGLSLAIGIIREALEGGAKCHLCDGIGEVDSGGFDPQGHGINIPCQCQGGVT